jgi:catalase
MVAGLRNVHPELAQHVADGLGLQELPEASEPARPPIEDLPPSPALSILKNGPDSLGGRKIGVLVSDGADAEILAALLTAGEEEGVTVEFVAPTIGGFETSDGSRRPADEQIDGGPSVLYDVVLILPSDDGASELARKPAAQDFVTDAYAHAKFIGYGSHATALFEATGLDADTDAGMIEIADGAAIEPFLSRCRELRFWDRPI